MSLKISGKINGDQFFGFTYKEYSNRPVSPTSAITNNDSNILLDPSHDRISSWAGVISYRFPVFDDDRYVKVIGQNLKCRLQPGYKAVRKMRIADGRNSLSLSNN